MAECSGLNKFMVLSADAVEVDRSKKLRVFITSSTGVLAKLKFGLHHI